ncbi:type VII secretion protein EccB [Motilibacter aurantiacus]|uniref:type VII secretion protein EccB n=1 Tax=Motilibacter aurantiacus TaxID=2714955 RepID=UPI00140DD423|nr:type VII secretion protein EccB [Motilibacter aurantiacus]NHC44045.1 type VII secretion protein EccB [Motilibacter aurantiacus]
MRSRRDQLHAYQFLARRTTDALVGGDADGFGPPVARITRATFAGAMLSVVVLAGFGVFGLVRPGSATTWREADGVVIERDTGARYAWFDGRLHPMLNYASARLAVGGEGRVSRVSAESLEGVPRTPTALGIPGAPDALPGPDDLVAGPWTACSAPVAPAPGALPTLAGARQDALYVGVRVPATPLAPDEALLVTAGEGAPQWLVWRGVRLQLPDPRAAVPLGVGDAPARPVGEAWLNTLPQGPDLAFPAVSGRGSAGPQVGGAATRVGTVLRARGAAGDQYALVLADGVAPLTPLAADLVLADPDVAAAYPGSTPAPVDVAPEALTAAPRATAPPQLERLPATRLRPADVDPQRRVLCVAVAPAAGASGQPQVAVAAALPGGTVPTVPAPAATPAAGAPARPAAPRPATADLVALPPGGVAYAQSEPAPGVGTTRYVVTDAGRRFAVADNDAAAALGYGSTAPLRVPPAFLALLPEGPALSRQEAGRPG